MRRRASARPASRPKEQCMTKMGRPPKPTDAVLTKRVTIPLNDADHAWLERQAAINKQTVAAYLREMIDTARREDDR